ncbi:MAG: hypothetical protein P4K93_07485 [Terracidiphilus sp.]|nr:hypothetical protein [Terracidiphilus sp.]
MALVEQRFTGVTAERFADMAAKVKQETGVEIAGNSGSAVKSGYGFRWNYDLASKVLAISVLAKPWIVPMSVVERKLREFVEA